MCLFKQIGFILTLDKHNKLYQTLSTGIMKQVKASYGTFTNEIF